MEHCCHIWGGFNFSVQNQLRDLVGLKVGELIPAILDTQEMLLASLYRIFMVMIGARLSFKSPLPVKQSQQEPAWLS